MTDKRKPIIRRDLDGSIDEIILYDLDHIHIEQMDGGHWWIGAASDPYKQPIHIHLRSRRKIRIEYIDEGES